MRRRQSHSPSPSPENSLFQSRSASFVKRTFRQATMARLTAATVFLCLGGFLLLHRSSAAQMKAIAVMSGNENDVKGTIRFAQDGMNSPVKITGEITGLKPGS
ncbi:SOD_CuZN7 [Ramazzottius varieornatus]|uniref:SOD_CuZN7 n=1 Tax=Ramazzottius varieornatus TaxID=947166 RepID=A0A1D1UTE0_RAMVA|nr:SOD_CuZN7 [Ramazzottius varieornatus]